MSGVPPAARSMPAQHAGVWLLKPFGLLSSQVTARPGIWPVITIVQRLSFESQRPSGLNTASRSSGEFPNENLPAYRAESGERIRPLNPSPYKISTASMPAPCQEQGAGNKLSSRHQGTYLRLARNAPKSGTDDGLRTCSTRYSSTSRRNSAHFACLHNGVAPIPSLAGLMR